MYEEAFIDKNHNPSRRIIMMLPTEIDASIYSKPKSNEDMQYWMNLVSGGSSYVVLKHETGVEKLENQILSSVNKNSGNNPHYIFVWSQSLEAWQHLIGLGLVNTVIHRRQLKYKDNNNNDKQNWTRIINKKKKWEIERINDPFEIENIWYIDTVYYYKGLNINTLPIIHPFTQQRLRGIENAEEEQYCDEARRILSTGILKDDRTGTGTLSVVGSEMRFDLSDNDMPLLTTRKLALRIPYLEEQWMLRGMTDAKILEEKKIHIWNGNTSREFLDKRGLTNQPQGSIGASYGFQIRHWGAKYIDCNTNYTGQGIDQLQKILNTLKNDPNSRRMMINTWNVSDLDKMSLEVCHFNTQFLVSDNKLSIIFSMRSSDFVLGCVSNIVQYALLLRWIAALMNFELGEIIYHAADVHVYLNHIDGLCQQLQREPRSFGKVTFNKIPASVDSFEWEDCDFKDYNPYHSIKFPMAV